VCAGEIQQNSWFVSGQQEGPGGDSGQGMVELVLAMGDSSQSEDYHEESPAFDCPGACRPYCYTHLPCTFARSQVALSILILQLLQGRLTPTVRLRVPDSALRHTSDSWGAALRRIGGEYESFGEQFRTVPAEMNEDDTEELYRRSVGSPEDTCV
jgi:hypothetical protein